MLRTMMTPSSFRMKRSGNVRSGPADTPDLSTKCSGDLPEDFNLTVLQPFIESLVQEIGRALQFFFTSTPHNKVDYILLSGGSASLPGLDVAVMNQTSFPCKIVNPFDGMSLSPSVVASRLAAEGTSYLVATGLALRRFSQ
jgi:type IV pilus assembly protein PilM